MRERIRGSLRISLVKLRSVFIVVLCDETDFIEFDEDEHVVSLFPGHEGCFCTDGFGPVVELSSAFCWCLCT